MFVWSILAIAEYFSERISSIFNVSNFFEMKFGTSRFLFYICYKPNLIKMGQYLVRRWQYTTYDKRRTTKEKNSYQYLIWVFLGFLFMMKLNTKIWPTEWFSKATKKQQKQKNQINASCSYFNLWKISRFVCFRLTYHDLNAYTTYFVEQIIHIVPSS